MRRCRPLAASFSALTAARGPPLWCPFSGARFLAPASAGCLDRVLPNSILLPSGERATQLIHPAQSLHSLQSTHPVRPPHLTQPTRSDTPDHSTHQPSQSSPPIHSSHLAQPRRVVCIQYNHHISHNHAASAQPEQSVHPLPDLVGCWVVRVIRLGVVLLIVALALVGFGLWRIPWLYP